MGRPHRMSAPPPDPPATWRSRLACGRPRKPLEPHRPLAWRLRALSWFAAAAGFLVLAPLPLLIGLEAASVTEAASSRGGVVCFGVALLLRWCSRLARPTPVLLAAIDEDV